MSVFFSIVYGMTQLIQVCDDIEEDELLRELTEPIDLDPIDGTESVQSDKLDNQSVQSEKHELAEESAETDVDLAEKAKEDLRKACEF